MASFEGKVMAISGGSSGMGLALSKLLISRGSKVSICDVVQENLESAINELSEAKSEQLMVFKCDVRDAQQVSEWISRTVEKFGQLDGAANMAGIIGQKPGSNFIAEQDEEDWERIMGINVTVSGVSRLSSGTVDISKLIENRPRASCTVFEKNSK